MAGKEPKVGSILGGQVEYVLESPFKNSRDKINVHPRVVLDQAATLSVQLVERWGMVAAKEGREDSAGRATLVVLTPDEVVTRAVETAELLMKRLEERGHIALLPSINDLRSLDGEAE